MEANGDAPPETLSSTPLVKPHALQSSAPMSGGARDQTPPGTTASGLREQNSVETLENSSEDIPRPAVTAGGAMVPAMATAAAGVPAVGPSEDDDDSSRDERSDLENPSELRRSGSNSSISTLGSTSTASSTWPTEHGFVTPARTDIARGIGGRYGGAGGRGKGHAGSTGSSGGGVEGLHMVGFKTPGNRGTSIPETPSPRSVSSSIHGTPAVSILPLSFGGGCAMLLRFRVERVLRVIIEFEFQSKDVCCCCCMLSSFRVGNRYRVPGQDRCDHDHQRE